MDEEKISFIRHYQSSIEKSQNNPERVLHCLKKLQNLRINVHDLQETGVGKTVNSLRKLDGEAGELATKLVTKWKDQISKMSDDEQQKFEPPREKHESKKHEYVKSSSSSENLDSNKKSKSHSSSSSSNHHHSSSSSHNNHSSSSKHHTNHLSSTNNHHSSSSSNHSEHKEKDKKSNEGKSSESKHHKSHHNTSSASTSSHKTSNSHKRSREDAESKENETKAKKMKSDHEKSDKKSNKSNDMKDSSSSSTTSNGTSSKSRKKDHKSPTKRKHSNDEDSQEFDGTQGIGFAEALAAFDMPSASSSKQKKQDQLADKIVSVKSSSSTSKSKSSSSSHKKDKEKDKSSNSSRPSTSSGESKKNVENLTQPPKLLTQKPKVDLLPDIVNDLPSDLSIPDYRPLPLNSAIKDYINANVYGSSSMQSRHAKMLSDEDLLVESFSSKANRTRVFSGNSKTRSEIPKLFEMCIRVLQENIDFLECTGGVPFDIIKPVLERAKPEQLANIEYYNPYLLEDSDILWKPHCQRKWKHKQPSEMETWREMYDRCTREDEEKLSRLTQNIRQQQEKTSNCVQKTKMAYVDTMVKAPRGMMRKQEQFGTSKKLVVSPAARVEALKNLQPNLAVAGDVRLRVAAGLRDDAQQIVGRGNMQRANLTKKAPMMAKILSKFKR